MAHFNSLFFLPFAFFVVQSESRDSTSVSAYLDEDLPLRCFDSKLDAQSCYRVKWTKYSSNGFNQNVILVRPETPKLPDAPRVKLETDRDERMFLLLTKVQKSDEGVYSCEIWRGWELITAKNFSLKVKECQSRLQTVSSGSPVTLDCSEGLQPRPHNLSWYTLKGGNPVQLSSERFQMNGTTISLTSVMTSDSGWFRCSYRLGHSERCLDINLRVQGSPGESTNNATPVATGIPSVHTHSESGEGFTAVHAVAVVFGIALISALVGVVLYWKCNNKKAPQQTPEYEDIVEYDVTYDIVDDFSPPEDFTSQPSHQQHFQNQNVEMHTWK